jgi:excisionase family DNA binding protein
MAPKKSSKENASTTILISPDLPIVIVPRLLRIPDAAKYLSATNWFMEVLVREGQIPAIKLGKGRVIDINDLNDWVEKEKAAQAISPRPLQRPPVRS